MEKNVIITRCKEENVILSRKIQEIGYIPIASPMISYKVVLCDFAKFKSYSNLIVTSKFAAQIIAEHYPYDVNAYVVGVESANILGKNNKIHVVGVYDGVAALLEALYNSQKYLYCSGNHISMDIPLADRCIIYNTEYADSLSKEAMDIISQNRADFIMFYSKNSAQNFIDLIKNHIHLQNLQNSVVIAISEEVGSILGGYVKNVLFPKNPNADEMLALLRKIKTREI